MWPTSRFKIQDDGSGLQGGHRNYTFLPPGVGQTTHSSASARLNYLSWAPGSAIAKSSQKSNNKVTTLLCFGTTVVDRAPCWCQDLRVLETQESLVQSSPWLHRRRPYPPPPLLLPNAPKKTPLMNLLYVAAGTYCANSNILLFILLLTNGCIVNRSMLNTLNAMKVFILFKYNGIWSKDVPHELKQAKYFQRNVLDR